MRLVPNPVKAIHPDAATVKRDDVTSEPKTEPRPHNPANRIVGIQVIAAEKRIIEVRPHSGALISHTDFELSDMGSRGYADPTTVGRMPDGVTQQQSC